MFFHCVVQDRVPLTGCQVQHIDDTLACVITDRQRLQPTLSGSLRVVDRIVKVVLYVCKLSLIALAQSLELVDTQHRLHIHTGRDTGNKCSAGRTPSQLILERGSAERHGAGG